MKAINPTICKCNVCNNVMYDTFSLVFSFFQGNYSNDEEILIDKILKHFSLSLKNSAFLEIFDFYQLGIEIGFYYENKNENIIKDISAIFEYFSEVFGEFYTLKLIVNTIKSTDYYYNKEHFDNISDGDKRLIELGLLVRKFLQEKLENLTDDEKLYLEVDGL